MSRSIYPLDFTNKNPNANKEVMTSRVTIMGGNTAWRTKPGTDGRINMGASGRVSLCGIPGLPSSPGAQSWPDGKGIHAWYPQNGA
jgi:hypothetical protein